MGLAGDIVQMNIGQLFQTPPPPAGDFTGQTIIITGANTGLGFEAAKHISSLKAAHLILACRNVSKGEQAREQMKGPGKVEVWELDMSNYSSVLEFGRRMQSLPRLDAFIANAGIDVREWSMYEGNESTITVNVISTFLVSMLAIPKLRETAAENPSHLTITGSVVHIFAKDKYLAHDQIFKSFNNESTADMGDRYNLSKLVLLLAYRQMAARLSSKSVITNFVNPGWCKTDLFRTNDGGMGGRIGLRLIGRTAEEGSRTLVDGLMADESSHGKYLSDCRVKPESSFVRSDASRPIEERIWNELVEILESIQPGVTNLK